MVLQILYVKTTKREKKEKVKLVVTTANLVVCPLLYPL